MARKGGMWHTPCNLSLGGAVIASACSSGLESDSFLRRLSYSGCMSWAAGGVPLFPCRRNCRPKPSWYFLSLWRLGSSPVWRIAPSTITVFLPGKHSDEDFGKGLSGALRCFRLSCWFCGFGVTFELSQWRSREAQFFGRLSPGPLHFSPCR